MNNHTIMQWQGDIAPFWPRDSHVSLATFALLATGYREFALLEAFPRVAQGISVPIAGGGPPLERDW
jgi:hypothetical protein